MYLIMVNYFHQENFLVGGNFSWRTKNYCMYVVSESPIFARDNRDSPISLVFTSFC